MALKERIDDNVVEFPGRTEENCARSVSGYNLLILRELELQKVSINKLASELDMTRSNLTKQLHSCRSLSEDRLYEAFAFLGIDKDRALLAVEWVGDIDIYRSNAACAVTEMMRELRRDLLGDRRDDLVMDFNPIVLHQAAKLGVDAIFNHQERVMRLDLQVG